MDVILGTAASVATTIITVLGAIFYLDRKIEAYRSELSGEITTNRRELSAEIATNRRELSAEIATNRRELSAEISAVRQSSEDAHKSIRDDLSEIKLQQAVHTERFKCIESHLNMSRPEE